MTNKKILLGLFKSESLAVEAIEKNKRSLGDTDKTFEYFYTKIDRKKESQKVWKTWRVRR